MRTCIAPRMARAAVGFAAALVTLGVLGVGWGADPLTERVSVSSTGAHGDRASISPAVSADGRFVAFVSDASNLVPGDASGQDIFVRDRLAGTTELISLATDGTQANRVALSPAISGDGRYVVFYSEAGNLVPNDTNDASDIFIRDRLTGVTDRVSVGSDGAQANADSVTPSISADGRYVTFTSLADNLVPDDSNDDRDVFVHDLETGVTELVSIASDGTQGNFASGGLGAGPARISSDGSYVVFGSFANNLVPGDTNSRDDIFVRDRLTNVTERVSIASDGAEGNGHSVYPDISDDGRYVVFASAADTLTPGDTNGVSDVFLRDREAGTTIRLSDPPGGGQGNGRSRFPVISADGRMVAYQSDASNLVPDDTNGVTDVFLHHLKSSSVERVSVDAGGSEGDGASSFATISADGSVVAYQSDATNLVAADTNGVTDAFAWGKPLLLPTTATPTNTPAPTATPCPSNGDVTGDGMTNSLDALFVLQFVAGLLSSLPNAEEADVNEDGRITSIDALLILQFDAGIIFCLPP